MRATGIIRRIDDLGRVVIPKEIRRNLNIKEGDLLELFLSEDNTAVTFKKYSTAFYQDIENIVSLVNNNKDAYVRVIEDEDMKLADVMKQLEGIASYFKKYEI